jgi:hypothetical protein
MRFILGPPAATVWAQKRFIWTGAARVIQRPSLPSPADELFRCDRSEELHAHCLCSKIFCGLDFNKILLRKRGYIFVSVNYVIMVARHGFLRCFILNLLEVHNTVQDLSNSDPRCMEVMVIEMTRKL